MQQFGAVHYNDLRLKLGLDHLEVRPVCRGRSFLSSLDVWGASANVGGEEGQSYSDLPGTAPLKDAEAEKDLESPPWPKVEDFDFAVIDTVLNQLPDDKASILKLQYAVLPAEKSATVGQATLLQAAGHVSADGLPIICTLFHLFGMEETTVKLHTHPKLIQAALERVESFLCAYVDSMLTVANGRAEMCWLGNDFAFQRGMLISPAHWRKFLLPVHKVLFAHIRKHSVEVWFRSCGTFRPVLPDLIDAGMNIWETVQIHCPGNDPETLNGEYGNDIAFYGAIDSQRTLPFGIEDDVRNEVRERIRVLGAGGGYICGPDHGILSDVPVHNVLAMIDEAQRQ